MPKQNKTLKHKVLVYHSKTKHPNKPILSNAPSKKQIVYPTVKREFTPGETAI